MKTAASTKFPGTPTVLGLAILSLFASSASNAESPGYAGASMGRTSESVNVDKAFRANLPPGFAIRSYEDGEKDSGFKIFAGYEFNQYLSLEGGYFDLGDFNYSTTTTPDGMQHGGLGIDGWNIDLVGTLPLTPKLSALARFGFNYADTDATFYGTGAVPSQAFSIRNTNSNYKYGLGLQYALNDALGLRFEAERFRLDEAAGSKGDVDMISLGFVYRFGTSAPVAAAPAPTPAPAVAAAAPRPAPTPAPPPPPAPLRVSLSADSLFDFNSAALKPAGMAELDKLAADLRGVNFDTIQVTGHTDRIGAQAYNLRLSNERALAVKDYLVRSANITAAQVTTRGINGSNPVTTLAQCPDSLARAELIVCLAPDRRVEVEVNGTRPR